MTRMVGTAAVLSIVQQVARSILSEVLRALRILRSRVLGAKISLSTNSYLRIAVDIDGELADVLDHRFEIRVGHLGQIELGPVPELNLLARQNAGEQGTDTQPA